MAKPKLTMSVTLPDGKVVTRTSVRRYTHAVVAKVMRVTSKKVSGPTLTFGPPVWTVFSWATRADLAHKERNRSEKSIGKPDTTVLETGGYGRVLEVVVVPTKISE